ncbi:MAG: SH3 domain-containing protein [Lachnospiraceae bacterium]|nr:SH3 domain-containing protein [Lachnospiraceae bacterium]
MGLVLNPLAWYEYLLDCLYEGSAITKPNPFRSDNRSEIELLEHLGIGTVTVDDLNVRDYPGYPDGAIITTLHKGYTVRIQRTNIPGWYALPSEWDTKIGYVRAEYIEFPQ